MPTSLPTDGTCKDKQKREAHQETSRTVGNILTVREKNLTVRCKNLTVSHLFRCVSASAPLRFASGDDGVHLLPESVAQLQHPLPGAVVRPFVNRQFHPPVALHGTVDGAFRHHEALVAEPALKERGIVLHMIHVAADTEHHPVGSVAPEVHLARSQGLGHLSRSAAFALRSHDCAAAAAEAAPAEKKEEEKEESDDDMGFSLFD